MRRRQSKKAYRKVVENLKPLTEALTRLGWFFEDFGKKLPKFRNGRVIKS